MNVCSLNSMAMKLMDFEEYEEVVVVSGLGAKPVWLVRFVVVEFLSSKMLPRRRAGTAMTAPASRRAASEAVVRPLPAAGSDAEMIFHLEEDAGQAMAGRERAVWRPSRLRWVDITSLMRLPGSRVERYLGHLNFFFIRESTSIREVRRRRRLCLLIFK